MCKFYFSMQERRDKILINPINFEAFFMFNHERTSPIRCAGKNGGYGGRQITLHVKGTETTQDILQKISDSVGAESNSLALFYTGIPVNDHNISQILQELMRDNELHFIVKNPTLTNQKMEPEKANSLIM